MVSATLAPPHSPKSFMGKREEGEERGDISGLGKEGGGQEAREGRERLEDRLETTRLAGRRGGIGLHWGGDTPAFARLMASRWGASGFVPLSEPRPRLCWEGGAQRFAPVLPSLA